jgi:hypothetical protein
MAALLVTSACAAFAVGTTAPAHAEPTVADAPAADQADVVFFRALDQAGVGHADDHQAVGAANNVCQRIRDGFSTAENVEELEKANPGLAHPHAVAFVKVARTVYCPGVGVGVLPGHPGQE